jgi:hypothetical protein
VAAFAIALVPLAVGIGFGHPTVTSLVSLIANADEQGRVQGAASAVESLGRTIGPVWGNASLEGLGDSTPYLSAAAILGITLLWPSACRSATARRGAGLVQPHVPSSSASVQRLDHRGDQARLAPSREICPTESSSRLTVLRPSVALISHVVSFRCLRRYTIVLRARCLKGMEQIREMGVAASAIGRAQSARDAATRRSRSDSTGVSRCRSGRRSALGDFCAIQRLAVLPRLAPRRSIRDLPVRTTETFDHDS